MLTANILTATYLLHEGKQSQALLLALQALNAEEMKAVKHYIKHESFLELEVK